MKLRNVVKRVLKKLLMPFDNMVERWTWERFRRTAKKIDLVLKKLDYANSQLSFRENEIRYYSGEKIRVVYLFQIASCWPSFQSVWEILKNDIRFDMRFLLYDREQPEKAQMAGAREFLVEQGIPFVEAEKFEFQKFRPHIMIYQTPWDEAHRPEFLRSNSIQSMGIRIAYIPYGIEYSDSVWLDYKFSNNKFCAKPWRIYSLSQAMKIEHRIQSPQGADMIAVTGLPKFDLLYHKENKLLDASLLKNIGTRKIVFWQMHFPAKDGTPDYPEPSIVEYIKFAKRIPEFEDQYYFLVRRHPKFKEQYIRWGYEKYVDEFDKVLSTAKNAYSYDESDYMPALLSADAVIGDRSALMIEAAVLNKPVLYMTNLWYKEKMLDAISPLFESYYQGSEAYDMLQFMDFVMLKGNDYKKQQRKEACDKCIPFYDGKCAERIVEDLVKHLTSERSEKRV